MTTDIADRRFIVGIDLGTTNCAVSYVDLLEKGAAGKRIRIFKIPQMTGPGEVSEPGDISSGASGTVGAVGLPLVWK